LGEKTGQYFGEEFGDRRGVGEDADMPGRIGAELGEFGFQVVHLAHDQARMGQQLVPGRGQFDATAVTVQQARVELRLQRLDPGAGGGRRQKRPACTLGQAG